MDKPTDQYCCLKSILMIVHAGFYADRVEKTSQSLEVQNYVTDDANIAPPTYK